MHLIPIPAFNDNYIWLLHDGKQALVVDPGQAEPVIRLLDEAGLKLTLILVTHHHRDHVGGVDLLRQRTGAEVLGPINEVLPESVRRVRQPDVVRWADWRFQVIDVPGHTAGHIAFHAVGQLKADASWPQAPIDDLVPHSGVLFCGDTLFSGGCGRLFEGTAEQMHQSLSKLAALPPDTLVCCAHEYTLSNLRFARAVEPNNARLISHDMRCQALRQSGRPTLPTTVGLERLINPFLRTAEPQVLLSAQAQDPQSQSPQACLATLRHWKNNFA